MIGTAKFKDMKIIYNKNRPLKPFYVVFLLEVDGKGFLRTIEIGLNPSYITKFYHSDD
jgi:hypothetical protein